MTDHVDVLIRLPADLGERLTQLAGREFRTLEAQAAWLIRTGVDRAENAGTAGRARRGPAQRQAVKELAGRLTALRLEAGGPSTRTIADGTGTMRSHVTVADVLAGRRTTSWVTVAAIVTYLGGDPADYKAGWAATH